MRTENFNATKRAQKHGLAVARLTNRMTSEWNHGLAADRLANCMTSEWKHGLATDRLANRVTSARKKIFGEIFLLCARFLGGALAVGTRFLQKYIRVK